MLRSKGVGTKPLELILLQKGRRSLIALKGASRSTATLTEDLLRSAAKDENFHHLRTLLGARYNQLADHTSKRAVSETNNSIRKSLFEEETRCHLSKAQQGITEVHPWSVEASDEGEEIACLHHTANKSNPSKKSSSENGAISTAKYARKRLKVSAVKPVDPSLKKFFEENFENDTMVFCNYLQACLYSGLLSHALNMLEVRIRSLSNPTHELRKYASSKMALDSQPYDVILSRLASISPNTTISCNFVPGNKNASPLDVIRAIFHEMRELGIKASPSAYASVLEALDKVPNSNLMTALCIQEIEGDGYTLDEVLGSCYPGSKSAKHIKSSIKRVMEHVEDADGGQPVSDNSREQYLPELVRDLYKEKPKPGFLNLGAMPNVNRHYAEQLKLERKGTLEVKSILSDGVDSEEIKLKKAHLSNLFEEWRGTLLQTFQDMKRKEKLKHSSGADSWDSQFLTGAGGKVYPFLCLLPDKDYVEIILNHLCHTINGGDFTVAVSDDLGQEVYRRLTMSRIKETGILERLQAVYKEYAALYSDSEKQSNYLPRELWLELEEKHGLTNLEEKVLPWHRYWSLLVGMKLVEVMNTVTFLPQRYWRHGERVRTRVLKERVPAIFNSYVVRGKRQCGMTIPHPQFRSLLRDALENLLFESEVAPMVVPPRPWCSMTRGGLLVNQVEFMRHNLFADDDESKPDPSSLIGEANVTPVYDSLNALGAVAWVLNEPILDLQIKYFQNKGCKELNVPQPASQGGTMPDLSAVPQTDTEEFQRVRQQVMEVRKTRNEMHSLFMEALYKLSIANMYRDKVIWFVHNIDFRGRCYPVARHLNYMGSDLYRSLFLFAEGRELEKSGLDWLKIHCINLTDFKKWSSIEDRLAYANEVLDDIIASADNPDADDAWWKTSDKPWQTLSACIEIAAAVRSPNPEKFVSRLPLHQDGSCNGLQHYAAMGRDILGAQQVNLAPADIPQDVYLGVAAKAEELRKQDAEKGSAVAQLVDGLVRRKVVKQTVMTTVYGVTRYGGMQQIKRQLGYLEDEFAKENCARGASYLVDKVFHSITEMFAGARNIQDWLTQLADVISKMGHPVDWVTPLNLLVMQPYYKQSMKYISSPVQRLQVSESMLSTPCPRKQRNGFPPNFVHSLDSTHMMLTALHCYNKGVTFASVHDCFWTHACDIDIMSHICRKQFVALHSQPILQQLADHLRKHLPKSPHEDCTKLHDRLKDLLDNVPAQGDFKLDEVMGSTFFFS